MNAAELRDIQSLVDVMVEIESLINTLGNTNDIATEIYNLRHTDNRLLEYRAILTNVFGNYIPQLLLRQLGHRPLDNDEIHFFLRNILNDIQDTLNAIPTRNGRNILQHLSYAIHRLNMILDLP